MHLVAVASLHWPYMFMVNLFYVSLHKGHNPLIVASLRWSYMFMISLFYVSLHKGHNPPYCGLSALILYVYD